MEPGIPPGIAPHALPVATAAIELQDSFIMQRSFSGHVQARRESELGFDSAGRLARVLVEEGVEVEQDELIAKLDTERLQAKRAELQAARAEAEAKLALANATLKRMRGVVEQGGVSRQGLDEAREGQRSAAAAVRLAEHRIISLDIEIEKTELRAPFAGTVIARLADEGRVLEAGQPVVKLQELAMPEIRVGIAGAALDALEPGKTYPIEWGEQTIPARLRTLLPRRARTTRTIDALFDPLAETAGLLPGDLVTLRLSRRIDQAGAWLPITALTEGERGLWSVLITKALPKTGGELSATHQIQRRTVDVIHQTTDRVYVRGALSPRDHIVLTGLQRIVPGQDVRIAVVHAVTLGDDHE
jgi:RND family efflux transporter MFP subunit